MAVATSSAFLTLIGILISDLTYAVVDPRIGFGEEVMKQTSGIGYWDRVWIEFKKDSLEYVSFFFNNPPRGDGAFLKVSSLATGP